MISRMYSVFDRKTQVYQAPICATNAHDACRRIAMAVFSQPSLMSRFPVDYDIVDVGEYNDETGKCVASAQPTLIMSLEQLHETMVESQTQKGD